MRRKELAQSGSNALLALKSNLEMIIAGTSCLVVLNFNWPQLNSASKNARVNYKMGARVFSVVQCTKCARTVSTHLTHKAAAQIGCSSHRTCKNSHTIRGTSPIALVNKTLSPCVQACLCVHSSVHI